jgi:hypothetical protein
MKRRVCHVDINRESRMLRIDFGNGLKMVLESIG